MEVESERWRKGGKEGGREGGVPAGGPRCLRSGCRGPKGGSSSRVLYGRDGREGGTEGRRG